MFTDKKKHIHERFFNFYLFNDKKRNPKTENGVLKSSCKIRNLKVEKINFKKADPISIENPGRIY